MFKPKVLITFPFGFCSQEGMAGVRAEAVVPVSGICWERGCKPGVYALERGCKPELYAL